MSKHNCYKGNVEKCIKDKAYDVWEKNGCKPAGDLDCRRIAEKTVKDSMKK